LPLCAKQAAVTVPTYPNPNTLIDLLMRRFYFLTCQARNVSVTVSSGNSAAEACRFLR